MNEQKNNGRGIFYGVIGIATLVVAIIGATFAYFTATAANNVITGNMASISLQLSVNKLTTRENTIGMIPMSNGMVEAAVSNQSTKGACIDDNGNAVCQIYQITLENESSAGQFVDGYVALRGGSGAPDANEFNNYVTGAKFSATDYTTPGDIGTTMRWAQVFPYYEAGEGNTKDLDEDGVCDFNSDDANTTGVVETTYTEPDCNTQSMAVMKFSTAGNQYLGVDTANKGVTATLYSIRNESLGSNKGNIRTGYGQALILSGDLNGNGICETTAGDNPVTTNKVETDYKEEGCTIVQDAALPEDAVTGDEAHLAAREAAHANVLTTKKITGTDYPVIGTNYVRVSNHTWQTDVNKPESYNRTTDVTSALVFNNSIAAEGSSTYYIVVWLTENGKNQTASGTTGDEPEGATTPVADSFFMGNVSFISAQGSEVSASFTDYTRVQSVNAVQ